MEQINTASRIHPLMATAALSVIALSVAGTAAITGLLPSSKADTSAVATAPQQLTAPQALAALPSPTAPQLAAQPTPTAQQLADAQMLVAKYSPQAVQPRPAPEVEYEKPVVKKVVHTPRRAPQQTRVAQQQAPNYRAQPAQPAQQASQPNYVGIGAGAVIGGLLGNQIGGGRGKKLATVAGAIGGGFLGNEIANRAK
ncbi:glycine zipper 2TM domain-containing protein [Massilia pseudoviolaceinigra]|uniref:glycine zipper 2TM domain-containing protein n=1 Tax=Massilia pseudoviolaceinigra TaxID=3057165 RepID=UPI002796512A|nr:glycine zipper 2TM domain-containing protein [Massilia sp. CCM 9206]MDQ1922713.1 glycine zipper 2TM domain-containing protein [Massilia sp. CCM 9206]